MLVSDGADHRRRRGSVLPALARRRLDRWVPAIVEQADVAILGLLAEARRSAGLIDVAPHARRATMAVVVQALFGSRLSARVDVLSDLFQRPQAYLIALGLYVLRRGTLVMPSPYLAGRDPRAWHDAASFDPQRFEQMTDEQRSLANRAWVPFGGGARSCIGFASGADGTDDHHRPDGAAARPPPLIHGNPTAHRPGRQPPPRRGPDARRHPPGDTESTPTLDPVAADGSSPCGPGGIVTGSGPRRFCFDVSPVWPGTSSVRSTTLSGGTT